MDQLRLGLMGLSAAEDALVATLFRLHRVDTSFIWSLTTKPPFDALLVDASCASDQCVPLMGTGTKLMRLGAMNGLVPGTMPRPIRSDLLLRWLNAVEVDILHNGRDPLVLTTTQSLPVSIDMAALAPVRKEDAARHAPALSLPSGARVKLRRWPPAGLLRGDVNRLRMATMLSRRPLSTQELATATRVLPEQCMAFVQLLHETGLLESLAVTAPATLVQTEAKTAAATPATRGIGRSLLKSLRHRFGL
jgi:hypothetical protein